MLRSIARAAATHHHHKHPTISFLSYSSKPQKSTTPFKPDPKKPTTTAAAAAAALFDEQERLRQLAADDKNPSLDVGPNGRPLFSSAPSLSHLSRNDDCTYFKLTKDALNAVLPEGLPVGMVNEFQDSMRTALLVRRSFLNLRDNFRHVVDPPMWSSNGKGVKVRKQVLLDGPVSCGKSIALAMLVQWAREEGWLVFYVPKGKEWTHGGFFYKHPQTGLWDTPVQAEDVLKDFLKYNESYLKQLPCQIFDPIPLGEGAGVGWLKDVDSVAIPEGTMLYELVKTGIEQTHAAVGVVVRLRKELSLVKDMPVLIAIDQYNNWFTFSEYEEPVTIRSCRPIHARELTMVKAFRSMMHDDMMVGAFSHSTAVGKLRKDLPDVPVDSRVMLPRYSLDEAETVCHYYLRQRLIRRESFSEENWKKIYFLSNGNGTEIRGLVPFMR
ncbi:28S ribosomal protein S29 [Spatholobus suberectus]|nr:28S ribosomal protein S29 [Spatholobus suberectus]